MAAEDYREVLQYELRSYNVTLQLNEAKEQLTVVVNRPADKEINYDELADVIFVKFQTWDAPYEKLKIIGRIEKQAKPEWQQVFEKPKKKGFLGGMFGGK